MSTAQYHDCERKVRHPTILSALTQIGKMVVAKKIGCKMAVYECDFCRGYHIGRTRNHKSNKMVLTVEVSDEIREHARRYEGDFLEGRE